MILLKLMLILLASKHSFAYPISQNCQSNCGEVQIDYPFGIGRNCSHNDSFVVTCNTSKEGYEIPYLLNKYELLNIFIRDHQARIMVDVAWQCGNGSNGDDVTVTLDLSGTNFLLSKDRNSVYTMGCGKLSLFNTSKSQIGCFPSCSATTLPTGDSSLCGDACCKTNIPQNLSFANLYLTSVSFGNQDAVRTECSYTAISEDSYFIFDYTNLKTKKQGLNRPLSFDWSAEEGMQASFHSTCVNESDQPVRYLCGCDDGFEGNPYLAEGCKDINECELSNGTICPNNRKCVNTPGWYYCSCPLGMRPHPNHPRSPCELSTGSIIGLVIASAILGVGVLYFLFRAATVLKMKYERRRINGKRQKNYTRHLEIISRLENSLKQDVTLTSNEDVISNQDMTLLTSNQDVISNQDITPKLDVTGRMRILGLEELEKATNKFDESLIVGRGGHGIVYKGILSDKQVIAIKRPIEIKDDKEIKIIKENFAKEIEGFLNEVLILSQLNHRNVVKLVGFCLEDEVPLLVYEFISNGTLTDCLHVEEGGHSLSWNDRLRIALETARSLSYLHSAASISVFHRDIKTSNILLTDGLRVKLSDFGASKSVQTDVTGVNTAAQGSFGYFDPEYFYSGRLTEKTDVYSFGVILVELMTRKKPNSPLPDGESLVAYFRSTMSEESRLPTEILDPQLLEEVHVSELESVAQVAETCTKFRKEERPTMKEVEMKLELLWKSKIRIAEDWNTRQQEPQPSLLERHHTEEDPSRAYSREVELIELNTKGE